MPDHLVSDLSAEDAKLLTLAKGSRARIGASDGAALRDETGRTYTSAGVAMQSLQLTAVQSVVAQAFAAGARGVEAVVVVARSPSNDGESVAAVLELGGQGVPLMTIADGSEHVLTITT